MTVEYRPRCEVCGMAWVEHAADCPREKYPHRVYLAARYSRRVELCGYRDLLETLGCKVWARWLDGGHQLDDAGLSVEAKAADRARFATEDWDDLLSCNLVISFTEAPRSNNGRGGRHVEFGAALALGKLCVVVGPRENVFHCHPAVLHYDSWTEFLDQFYPVTRVTM